MKALCIREPHLADSRTLNTVLRKAGVVIKEGRKQSYHTRKYLHEFSTSIYTTTLLELSPGGK